MHKQILRVYHGQRQTLRQVSLIHNRINNHHHIQCLNHNNHFHSLIKPSLQQQQQQKSHNTFIPSIHLHPLLQPKTNHHVHNNVVVGIAGMINVYEPSHFSHMVQQTRQNIELLVQYIESLYQKFSQQQEKQQQQHQMTSNDALLIIDITDEISNQLCLCLDYLEFIICSHQNSDFKTAAHESKMQIGLLLHELNNNTTIHSLLKLVEQETTRNDQQRIVLTSLQKHCLEVLAKDMEKYGSVGKKKKQKNGEDDDDDDDELSINEEELLEETKQKLIETSALIDQYGYEFGHCLNQSKHNRNEEARGLDHIPRHKLDDLKSKNLLSNDRKMRYIFNHSANSKALALLDKLLEARQQLAELLKQTSFAHHNLQSFIIGSPEKVKHFLHDLSAQIKPKVEEEIEVLRREKMALEGPNQGKNIYAWDVDTYIHNYQSKQDRLGKLSTIRYYLHSDQCVRGALDICERLFRVKICDTPLEPHESWNRPISKLEIYDEQSGDYIGRIYLDLKYAPYKVVDSGNFSCQGSKTSINQKPISVVSLNVRDDYYTMNDLKSLFHELGHAMHVMFAQTPYQNLSGTRVSIDWAEVPSQFMEHFANDYRVLKTFAKHKNTQEVLPEELFNSYLERENMFRGLETQDQIVFAMVDISLHLNEHKGLKSTSELLYKVREQYHSASITEGNELDSYFPVSYHGNLMHMVNYGASYYSYLYSRISSDHLWYKFFAGLEDPVNSTAAEPLKRALSYGGTVKESKLIQELLGEEPDPRYFLKEFERHNK